MDYGQSAGELCQFCGQAAIDKSENDQSVLCLACREKMIRRPVPKAFILFAAVIAVILGAALYRFPAVLECYRIYHSAPARADSGEISDALTGLNAVIEKYPDAIPISVRAVDLAMDGGYYEFAGYVIGTYLSGREVDQDIADRLNRYVDRLERYYTTSDAMAEMASQIGTGLPQEEIIKACHDHIQGLLDDAGQDKALLYYFLSIYARDTDEAKSCLENCLREDETFLTAKVDLAKLLRRQGDLATAEKYCEEVLSKDKSNSGALRGLAILRLLEGNGQAGLDLAYEAYALDPEGLYIWETYIIALNENGKSDEAGAQIDAYLAKGNNLDGDTLNYLDGKVSLRDYYVAE